MAFKMQFETDNAAFDDDKGAEIARILRDAADTIERSIGTRGGDVFVRDSNGNKVGKYTITSD
jgi:hypothetical protein